MLMGMQQGGIFQLLVVVIRFERLRGIHIIIIFT